MNSVTITVSDLLSVIVFSIFAIYGLRLLKVDWALEKRTEKKSVLRSSIVGLSAGCIMLTAGYVYEVVYNFGAAVATFFGFICITGGYILVYFSMFTVTILDVQAMELAGDGVVATRKWWLILLRKYTVPGFFLTICAIGAISVLTGGFDLMRIITFCFLSVWFLCLLFLYGCLFLRLRTLTRNQTSTNERISKRCNEMLRFTILFLIGLLLQGLASVINVMFLFGLVPNETSVYNYWVISLTFYILIYATLQDISRLLQCNNINFTPRMTCETPLIEPKASPNQRAFSPIVNGIAITNSDQHCIGMAPHASRPVWLPTSGIGQSNVLPDCWSISLENWVNFVHGCMATATWSALVDTKGEGNITMYDINTHFIKPWTKETGCSIACLMDNNQGKVELMVSHAWAGSVIESLASIKTITTMYLIPKNTLIFFDTMCMYQAEDGANGGLSIEEQLTMKPFTTIIHQRPRCGMYIIHTTISEVYDRLWCVHEVDEAIEAKIEIYGAFDPASWNTKALKSIVTQFSTRSAKCLGASDKVMLTDLIIGRGGFDRLDNIVRDVRQQSIKDLEAVNLFEQLFGIYISSVETFNTDV